MGLVVADCEEALQIPDKRFTRVRGASGGGEVEADKNCQIRPADSVRYGAMPSLLRQHVAFELGLQHLPAAADFLRPKLSGGNTLQESGPRDTQVAAGFAGVEDPPHDGHRRIAAAAAVEADTAVYNGFFFGEHFFSFPALICIHCDLFSYKWLSA